jgi:hypothetical protein
MNAKERLQKAIAGQPTAVPVVAPAYLSLRLHERTQRLYRAAYERKLAAQTEGQASGTVSIDHDEVARFRAEAILGAYGVFAEPPDGTSSLGDWLHTLPGETHAWAKDGEMRLTEGRWHYANRITGDTSNLLDALALEESKKGFSGDIADVVAGVDGACCVFGNVDAIRVMLEGTRKTIQVEVHRQLSLGQRAKRFVLCQGSSFTLDTLLEKVGWFVPCARQFNSSTSGSRS